MWKLIIGLILFLVISGVGLIIEKKYKNKTEIYKELAEFLNFGKREIQFLKTTVPELTRKFKEQHPKIGKEVESTIFEEDTEVFKDLKDAERFEVEKILRGLKNLDFASVEGYCKKGAEELEALEKKAKKLEEQRGKLAAKLAPLLGLFLLVLLL